MPKIKLVNFLLWLRAVGFKLSPNGHSKIPRALLRRLFRYANATVQIDDFAGSYIMDLQLSEHMQRRIFWMGYYNEDIVRLLERTLNPGMTFVDIGANVGEISLFAAKQVGIDGHVFAFEPVDKIASKLDRHIQLNQLAQISVQRFALGDAAAESIPIYASHGQNSSDNNEGLGSIYTDNNGEAPLQNVPMIALDGWLIKNPISRLDLIKIDIEGAEYACLRGATECLSRFRPKIIIEIQDFSARRAGHAASDILDFLSGFNYEFYRIERGGTLTALTSANLGSFQNVLCTPCD